MQTTSDNQESAKSLRARVRQIELDVAANALATTQNTESIEQIRQNTQDIVETFQTLSAGFRVLQGLGRIAKPLAGIIGLFTVIMTSYSAWRGFK